MQPRDHKIHHHTRLVSCFHICAREFTVRRRMSLLSRRVAEKNIFYVSLKPPAVYLEKSSLYGDCVVKECVIGGLIKR